MNFVVTNEQMKLAEKAAVDKGTTYLELMKNAGNACFERIRKLSGDIKDKSLVILAGKGNNGGDGIVISQLAIDEGARALLVFVKGLPASDCAKECYALYKNKSEAVIYSDCAERVKERLAQSDIIVDCVFGTGFHGELEAEIGDLFAYINNDCKGLKVSVDVPSGCNSDTGEIAEKAFRPDVTLTLGAVKKGLLSHPCFDFCGSLSLLKIGIDGDCYEQYEAALTDRKILSYLPERTKSAHKGTYGRLLNISGSEGFIGAAVLSTKAALRTGTGIVTLAAVKEVIRAVACNAPEATFLPLEADEEGFIDSECTEVLERYLPKVTAVSIGCGMGNNGETREIAELVLKKADCPVILDADGINSVSANINVLKDNKSALILTPHPAEFGRLTGLSVKEIQADRIALAKAYAKEWNAVVALKGVNTVIASPDGKAFVNTTGNAGLAKGGSGDVLTGIIAGLAAQGVEPFSAAVLGVYLHGLAADRLAENMSMAGILPSDIIERLPFVMK